MTEAAHPACPVINRDFLRLDHDREGDPPVGSVRSFLAMDRRGVLVKLVMPGLKREARLRADVPNIHVLLRQQQERRG
jgi:hypothetical protein